MKRWRRTASAFGAGGESPSPPPPSPTILSAQSNDDGTVNVRFSEPVTWDGTPSSTFTIAGDGGVWQNQFAPDLILWVANSTVPLPGDPWSWSGPDPTLSPVPNPAQTGLTT